MDIWDNVGDDGFFQPPQESSSFPMRSPYETNNNNGNSSNFNSNNQGTEEAQMRARLEREVRMQMMGEAKMRQQEQELKRLQDMTRMKARNTHKISTHNVLYR